MRELNLIAQVSLDGFVAGTKGEFDKFLGGEENLEFVCSIINSADAIMLGRVSFELLNAYWPTAASKPGATKNEIHYSNWYNAADKFVVSTTMSENANITVIKDDLLSHIATIKQRKGKNILLFGSPTLVNTLLPLQLIDHIWLIVHPVTFGKGIPLFTETSESFIFELVQTSQLSNGTLCNKYKTAEK